MNKNKKEKNIVSFSVNKITIFIFWFVARFQDNKAICNLNSANNIKIKKRRGFIKTTTNHQNRLKASKSNE